MSEPDADPGQRARRLVRAADRAALATALTDDGAPFASLVLTACAPDASPLLLISDLAEHTRNAGADPRVSLLFDGTGGLDDPLTGPRVTLLGRLVRDDTPGLLARFCARHPAAGLYAGFADFHLHRLEVARAHLVAGFGEIRWIDSADWRFHDAGAAQLAAAGPDIVAHMNKDHADALALCATRLLARGGGAWQMTGIDPEGCDLRLDGAVARLEFASPVADAAGARAALVEMITIARAAS
ncbi:MAG: DUF2470 domain-containing protein [Alphaproteobacteria bacterium]